jgi:hypothetical protein
MRDQNDPQKPSPDPEADSPFEQPDLEEYERDIEFDDLTADNEGPDNGT